MTDPASNPAFVEALLSRNREAMAAGARGDYAEALAILHDVHSDAARARSPLVTTIRANLAVLSMLAGDLPFAQRYADSLRYSPVAGVHGTAVVGTAVQTAIARVEADRNALAEAVAAQRQAVREYLTRARNDDPLALAGLAGLLAAEVELATGRRAVARDVDPVIEALETTAQRTAAVLGLSHPQSLVAWTNLTLAEFQVAMDRRKTWAMRRALRTLFDLARRTYRALGEDHPQSLTTAANLASAQFELARTKKAYRAAVLALTALQDASERTTRILGADHPQALVALSNYASAEFELARIDGSRDQFERALRSLETASDQSYAVLGAGHPSTRLLREELQMCQALLGQDDDLGPGSVLTKARTATMPSFDDEYLSLHDAVKALDSGEAPAVPRVTSDQVARALEALDLAIGRAYRVNAQSDAEIDQDEVLPGQIRSGVVITLEQSVALVDLGPRSGQLRLTNASEILTGGQRIIVKVVHVDPGLVVLSLVDRRPD